MNWARCLLTALMAMALLLPPGGLGAAIVLEAENAVRTGTTVSTAVSGYSGTGYVTGFDSTGDNVKWTFNASNGLYRLQIRFRSQYGEKGFDATVNGSTTSAMFPSNSAFSSFDDGLVELTNGSNTLQIGGGWNYYEIDRADLTYTNPPARPLPVPAAPVNPQASLAARQLMADLVTNYGQITWSGTA